MWRHLKNLQKTAPVHYLHKNELCPAQLSNIFMCCANSTNSTGTWTTQQNLGKPSFEQMIKNRRVQAMQTVVINASEGSYDRLMAHCSQYGSIRRVFFHEAKDQSYFIVEFSRHSFARDLVRDVGYGVDTTDGKFLYTGRFFKYQPDKKVGHIRRFQPPDVDMKPKTWQQLLALTRTKKTSNEQIQALYEFGALSDLSSRLRFSTAMQIEEAVEGIGMDVRVLPFGSSVNGFGRTSSDLDMIMMFESRPAASNELQFLQSTKASRRGGAKNLEVLSHVITTWLPGVSNYENILAARVPIVKFDHTITGLQCDLSMSNM